MKNVDDLISSARTVHDRYAASRMERETVREWVLGLSEYREPYATVLREALEWYKPLNPTGDVETFLASREEKAKRPRNQAAFHRSNVHLDEIDDDPRAGLESREGANGFASAAARPPPLRLRAGSGTPVRVAAAGRSPLMRSRNSGRKGGGRMSACRIGFIMEQTMGHVTYQRSLASWSKNDASIIPTWFPIPYWRDDKWARIPGVRTNASMYLSLRARDDLRLARAGSECDVLFFHTQGTAMCSTGFARRVPVVVSLDATPINMDSVAEGYNHRPDDEGAVSRLKRSIYRWVFRKATALTTWNQWAKDSLIRDYLVPADKVEVIPPASTWTSGGPIARRPTSRSRPASCSSAAISPARGATCSWTPFGRASRTAAKWTS